VLKKPREWRALKKSSVPPISVLKKLRKMRFASPGFFTIKNPGAGPGSEIVMS
jgi:hypothetical protein